MDLLELRKEIDRIDDQLIPLLMARMDVSEQVAKYKVERGIPVLNEERERQILDDVAGKCGDRGETIKTVFAATMDASRALQHKMMDGGADLRKELWRPVSALPVPVWRALMRPLPGRSCFPVCPSNIISILRMYLRQWTRVRHATALSRWRTPPPAVCMSPMT